MTYISKKPIASVIMPCYNSGDFLHSSIESILNQSLPPLQVLSPANNTAFCNAGVAVKNVAI